MPERASTPLGPHHARETTYSGPGRSVPDPDEEEGDAEALFETLDLLPQHQALLTEGGRFVRVNRSLGAMLRRVPDRRMLEEALSDFARQIAGGRYADVRGEPPDAPAMRRVRMATGACRLWGWCVELDRYGLGRLVLMTVQPEGPDPIPGEALWRRLGLTRKEIAVARLLAEGRSNTGIAAVLCISPHTARHHTERIMAKLGARSRAEVGHRLRVLGAEEDD